MGGVGGEGEGARGTWEERAGNRELKLIPRRGCFLEASSFASHGQIRFAYHTDSILRVMGDEAKGTNL